jgi:hypothetical protein
MNPILHIDKHGDVFLTAFGWFCFGATVAALVFLIFVVIIIHDRQSGEAPR